MFGLGKKKFAVLTAGPDDYGTIARLHDASFPRGWSQSEIMELAQQASVTLLIAKEVGSKSGLIAGFNLIRHVEDEAEILSIAVSQKFQKQGLGDRLMREALLKLHHDRIKSLFLEVDSTNRPAIRLYENLGFKTIANRPGYYQKNPQDESVPPATALVMRLELV